jgi:hypothetical protein
VCRFAAAALTLLLPSFAFALDETALFRQSATDVLVKKGLERADSDAFVCVSVENKAPSEAELTRFGALVGREIGRPEDCRCVDADPLAVCTRVETHQAACTVYVTDIQFWSFDNARATMTVNCGWPRGGGETARFEKQADGWHYIEAVRFIKF